ncbi:MAG: Mrp/NBP35 family ATP-binding protein [Deltaproteobacteria bacterium]|nr:Mrp/NBP35 family ATP-binding protein [Deltaproteobacteria bacterium]
MALSKKQILDALRPIQDPDLGRSIVDLDFIKRIEINKGEVSFDLVLTTPACPVREIFKRSCEDAVSKLAGVTQVNVTLKAETRGAPLAGRQVLESVKNVIAVASGKGGVAKSTTAVNLAVCLQQSGASVGLLDADIYGPSVPTMVAIDEEPATTADGKIIPASGLGLRLISMGFFLPPGKAAILRGPMVSGYITQFLSNVEWGELDYLIIDYPPGTGDVQLTLSQQAAVTAAILCTTPQKIALVDVQKAVSMFDTTKVPVLGVVETMSYFLCDQCEKEHHIFGSGGGQRIADSVGVPLLGRIPIDPRVVTGGDTGSPIVKEEPSSPAAKAYAEVTGAMAAQLSVLNLGDDAGALANFSLDWEA